MFCLRTKRLASNRVHKEGAMSCLWRKRLTFVLVAAIAMLFTVRLAEAQNAEGTITGTVTDETAAVVPNATVTITNTLTGAVARTTETNASGIYVAGALPVGTYQVAVEARGFQRAVRTGITLNVADRLGVDFVLKIGAVTQSVEVKAEAATVETQTGEQSTLVTTQQLGELPMLGRNFFQLQQLLPGASNQASDEIGKGYYSTQGFSFNGIPWRQTGNQVDGVQNIDWGSNGGADLSLGPDTLAEFKVLASNYSAKYGTASGAAIVSATKSGTRDFHGTAYDYVRNDKFDAADFFLNAANELKSPLRYNDFGYNIGGPFYIPGHYNTDKSKTFFFWDQEWIREETLAPVVAATPTQAMRNGDFSAEQSLLGLGPLTNPTNPQTGLPMTDSSGNPCVSGTQVNPGCFNSNVGLLLAQDFPMPTPGETGFLNFVQGAATGQNWSEQVIRVDQNIKARTRAFVRFAHDTWKERDPIAVWSSDSFPTIGDEFDVPARNLVVKLTNVLSPSLLNEVSYGYNSNDGSPNTPVWTPTGAIHLPAGYTAQTVFHDNLQNLVPDMTFASGYGGIDAIRGAWWSHENTSQAMDDLSKQLGPHSLQMGFVSMFSIGTQGCPSDPYRQGGYYFDGHFTGNPISDALLGLPDTYGELEGCIGPVFNHHQDEAYFQDDWKATRRLTLNLGVRWFYIPHFYSDGVTGWYASQYNPSQAVTVTPAGNIIPGSGNLLNGIVYPGKNGVPRSFTRTHWDTFAPRFGFAWDPRGDAKTAIRGGFGMGYSRIEANDIYDMISNPPISALPTYFSPPFNSPSAVASASVPEAINTLDPVYKVPTNYNWSFGVQRALTANTLLSVAYVGSREIHMDTTENINQPLPAMGYDFDPRIACTTTTPYPCTQRVSTNYVVPYAGWSTITDAVPIGSSMYHSLQVKLEKKMSHGLMFGTAYTWSRAIGYMGAGGFEGDTPQDPYNLKAEKGVSDFDRTHMLIINYVYELPFAHTLRGVAGGVLKGWETTGIAIFESGMPVNPGISTLTSGLATRPDAVAGTAIPGPKTVQEWFNTAAFTAPPFGYYGNASVNCIRGPGMNNWDMSLFKNFRISESAKLQFRFETFNTWNHTNFSDSGVDTTYGTAGFGQLTSDHTPRVIQFALRLTF